VSLAAAAEVLQQRLLVVSPEAEAEAVDFIG
jgi:hypothetical protein